MSAEWTAIEREYSQSSMVESLEPLLTGYRLRSLEARDRLTPATYAYGDLACETVDLFSAGSGAPAHVFVHGGYWQELGKEDSLFPAPGFVGAGITFVAVDYGLAPQFRLDEIVAQVRHAVAWVAGNHTKLGIDADRIVVSGSSAGAQLAVMAATGQPVSGLVLMSGIYDLEPLIGTYINDALRLDREAAHRNSPLRQRQTARPPIPAVIAWAEHETTAFKRQSRRFAEHWSAAGNPVARLEVTGRNHFDIVYDLSDRESPLGRMVADTFGPG
jgi:arylformamidase